MDNKQILNQMIRFNKTIFDNAFKAMEMAQDQGEKILTSLLDQAAWLPDEGKKTITQWVTSYQKGFAGFRAIDCISTGLFIKFRHGHDGVTAALADIILEIGIGQVLGQPVFGDPQLAFHSEHPRHGPVVCE